MIRLFVGLSVLIFTTWFVFKEGSVSFSDRRHIEQLHVYGDFALGALLDGREEEYDYYTMKALRLRLDKLSGFTTAPIFTNWEIEHTYYCNKASIADYNDTIMSLGVMQKVVFPQSDWPFNEIHAEQHLQQIKNGFYDFDERLEGWQGDAYRHCDELFPGYIARMRSLEAYVDLHFDLWVSRFETLAERKVVFIEENRGQN